jgi:hypothetical protein
MDLSDLGHTVAKYAPLLGGALSGPGGIAIGSILASVFGSDTNKPDKLQNLIITDPEAAIKLRQIESDHQLELRRMILQAAQMQQNDRENARKREADVDNTPMMKRDHTPAILAYMLTLGVFVALASLFYFPVPISNQEVILGIVTSLTTVWVGAMGYYHGSSSGSRMKDVGVFKILNHK